MRLQKYSCKRGLLRLAGVFILDRIRKKSFSVKNCSGFAQTSVDRMNKNSDSNLSGIVWTGPKVMPEFRVTDLIATKRDGEALTRDQICFFASRVATGEISESQIGAMLMAIYLKGMNTEETVHLTDAMVKSGETLSWPEEWGNCIGDKHSTGGVGDKVSLPLAPALAACEVKVPMISGRGLGHTGGTLDKLESIPGFRVSLTPEEMKDVLKNVGCCIVGQNKSLVPADRVLYAVRDVTGTVDSDPLIASSIISKKVAESLTSLVLDVKCGRAAFAKTKERASVLARTLVNTCEKMGTRCKALVTSMDHPIGKTVGNSVEVAEAIQCLHGQGPDDLKELVCLLGGHLLNSLGKAHTPEEGMESIKLTLSNGMAIKKFSEMLVAQGVSQEIADALCNPDTNPYKYIPLATKSYEVKAQKSGIIKDIDALECATLCGSLGAGRQKSTDKIDHGVGMVFNVRVGEYIKEGETWVVIYHSGNLTDENVKALQNSIVIKESDSEESLPVQSRLIEVIDAPQD
ncbi:thymidine phosphorylase-like [Actinia tenebrosa]|uniref:Thymidine phosphorylase n=1 Tax=Actinia tenebrosa TaxID=6105 RepID=A0A6P8H8D9_ACTTE|nr:thymidine phosphorylase-like [Actinia tenebrosa]